VKKGYTYSQNEKYHSSRELENKKKQEDVTLILKLLFLFNPNKPHHTIIKIKQKPKRTVKTK